VKFLNDFDRRTFPGELKLPYKDSERERAYNRAYLRAYKAKQRRARGAVPNNDPNSIKNVQPWREHGVSRATWYHRHRWMPAERERFRHRERA
jgi:hypothetical protein